MEELAAISKTLLSVTNEKEKLRMKIMKLRKRRIIDFNQKICKNCGKEYLENDNYNWSCRTHRVSCHRLNDDSLSMEARCGGAVAKHLRMPKDASMPSMSLKMKMKTIKIMLRINRTKLKLLSVSAAKRKAIRLKIVQKTLT